MSDIVWSYRDAAWTEDRTLIGYDVYASDGPIGSIDEATGDADGQWLVVDTGFWIFGKKRLIPAGTVVGVDHDGGQVTVSMSKDQIKSAPDFDDGDWDDHARGQHTDYYAPHADRGTETDRPPA